MNETTATLEVRDLSISVRLPDGRKALVVDQVAFTVPAGGTLGLVGESGSGKTMTSLAIMGLLPPAARVESGSILLAGDDLLKMDRRQLQRTRGKRMAMVLQDALTALDPSFTIRSQLSEPLRQHLGLRGPKLEAALIESLERVHLSAAKERLNQYPHQLSGGMRQRVTSAIALAGRPELLIADEPTTALDVTTQVRYLRLLRELQASTNFALLLVAHDLMLVRHVAHRVVVMYAGQIVEQGTVAGVFEAPQHPYTRALLGAIPVLAEQIHLESIPGRAPDVGHELIGCRFAARCTYAASICETKLPELTDRDGGQLARCFGTEPGGWITA